MRLSDLEADSIEDILSDDPLEAALEGLELGSFLGSIAKGLKSVGKIALPIVKMVPGIGNVVSAAETGANIAAKLGVGNLLDPKKKGAVVVPIGKLSTSATPAVIQAAVRASAAQPAPKKSVTVMQTISATKRAPQAAAIQPTVIVKAAPLDINRIVGNFSASVSPQLNAIAGLLQQQKLQTHAQSEHNQRIKDAQFKRLVVKKLAVKG